MRGELDWVKLIVVTKGEATDLAPRTCINDNIRGMLMLT